LKVAVDATVRFIAEQSVQTILRFSHKTPNQPDVKQLTQTFQLLPGKQTIDSVHKINNATAANCQPKRRRQKEREREIGRAPARTSLYSTSKLDLRNISKLK